MSTAVVFDLDGTLIDSAPDIHVIANRVLTEIGVEPISLQQTRSFIGNGAAAFVTRMREARGIAESHQDELHRAFLALYDDAVGLTTVYPDVPEILEELRSTGALLGICTNKPLRPAESVLRHMGLSGFFKAVRGGDSLPQRKPDPAPLLDTFAALGKGQWIYVGDSEIDAETASRAEVPFLLFTRGYRKKALGEIRHAAAFDSFRDLPGLIRQHAAQAPGLLPRKTTTG